MILNIETSTNVCSVALSKDDELIAEKTSFQSNSHSKLLAHFIDDILKENNISPKKLKAIAVSQGPGSYTGLRIGVSTAKGLAYSLNIPLIAIDTLQIMSQQIIKEHDNLLNKNPILCPMIDARRMEVYTAFFDTENNKISQTTNMIIDQYSFLTPLQSKQFLFFGDGSQKCKTKITHSNAIFVENIFPLAKYMVDFSEKLFNNKKFVDVAYFEPFYLKPFIATTPKNKLKP